MTDISELLKWGPAEEAKEAWDNFKLRIERRKHECEQVGEHLKPREYLGEGICYHCNQTYKIPLNLERKKLIDVLLKIYRQRDLLEELKNYKGRHRFYSALREDLRKAREIIEKLDESTALNMDELRKPFTL